MEKGRLALLWPSTFVFFVMLQHFFCEIATSDVLCCNNAKIYLFGLLSTRYLKNFPGKRF